MPYCEHDGSNRHGEGRPPRTSCQPRKTPRRTLAPGVMPLARQPEHLLCSSHYEACPGWPNRPWARRRRGNHRAPTLPWRPARRPPPAGDAGPGCGPPPSPPGAPPRKPHEEAGRRNRRPRPRRGARTDSAAHGDAVRRRWRDHRCATPVRAPTVRPRLAPGSSGEDPTALAPARLDDGPTRPRRHTVAKAVVLGPLTGVRLKGTFHGRFLLEPSNSARRTDGCHASRPYGDERHRQVTGVAPKGANKSRFPLAQGHHPGATVTGRRSSSRLSATLGTRPVTPGGARVRARCPRRSRLALSTGCGCPCGPLEQMGGLQAGG